MSIARQLSSLDKITKDMSGEVEASSERTQGTGTAGTYTQAPPLPDVSPASVLKLTRITEDYLCPPQANIYGIDFTRFKIRDVDSNVTLFEIAKPVTSLEEEEASQDTGSEPATNQRTGLSEVDQSENGRMVDLNAGRFVRYQFTPQFLKLRAVGA